jgi:hypothetical protein
VSLRIGEGPAHKLRFVYRNRSGRPMTGLAYFVTDALARNWRILYRLTPERMAAARAIIERLERG